MREIQKVVIGEWEYSIRQMGAVEGRKLSLLFAQLLGRVVPFITTAGALDGEALQAVGSILDGIEPAKLEPLWEAYARDAVARSGNKTVILGGDNAGFDDHFAGSFFEMWSFFVHASRVNFGGFLAKLTSQVAEKSVAEGSV